MLDAFVYMTTGHCRSQRFAPFSLGPLQFDYLLPLLLRRRFTAARERESAARATGDELPGYGSVRSSLFRWASTASSTVPIIVSMSTSPSFG